jgi:2,3-bisphosphoglycerate-independent phosphoglycerate mutase
MKYIVLVADGMADYPIKELEDRTPLEAAQVPNMDYIARHGRLGRVTTIPAGMTPASDIANMSILGYNPREYYSGRGPLEAVNLGIDLADDDVAFRCNLVTVAEDILIDYSAGHISTAEAAPLIEAVGAKLGGSGFRFYPGTGYRHIMVATGAGNTFDNVQTTPPHDISGKKITGSLPRGANAEIILTMMQESRAILEHNEINGVRIDLKENPGNMIWLWGQGKRPRIPKLTEKYGLTGSVISAVDLIKGLGSLAGLEVINVPGATGYYDTDYAGKAKAALRSLETKDFVFVHVEAPDEAGHNGDLREKITAIERFDKLVVGTIIEGFKRKKNFRILVLPDHATPISLRTHAADPILFGVFGEGITGRGFLKYSEKEAEKSDLHIEDGSTLMDFFIKNPEGNTPGTGG